MLEARYCESTISHFLSKSGPLANLDIYQIRVEIDSCGYVPEILKESINEIYLSGIFQESKPEFSKIIATVLDHSQPSSSIFNIGDSLNASLAARYPKARHITSYLPPNIKSRFNVKGLSYANCIIRTDINNVKHTDTQKGTRFSTKYCVISSWRLPIHKNSLKKFINIQIKTTEHHTLSIYDLRSGIIQSRKDPDLGQIHPTFDVHQKVAEQTVPFLKAEEDIAPLRLARLGFGLADEQSPCKRIDEVGISMTISTKRTEQPFLDDMKVFTKTSIDRVRYEQFQNSRLIEMLCDGSHRVYVALGSNVGDRIGNIESACQRMYSRGIKVTRTSALYETKAMYLEDQQSFINGACEVSCAQESA